ncbi:MAG TPA: hypothetical protein VFT29_02905 [Gemmatimonadaceae bacterium]|nr:hypothetical protein [Gemmatimonadaceae bacterium]
MYLPPMPEPVPRRSRVLDAWSVALVVVGAAAFVWTYVQMEGLRNAVHDPEAPLFAGYVRFVRLTRLSYVGLGLVGLGLLVGIGAALHARRAARRGTSK